MTNTEQTPNDHRPAGACQVQHTVRPGAEAPRWWHCDTHGGGTHTAWGCPDCVRELRALAKEQAVEIQTLRDALNTAGGALFRLAPACIEDDDALMRAEFEKAAGEFGFKTHRDSTWHAVGDQKEYERDYYHGHTVAAWWAWKTATKKEHERLIQRLRQIAMYECGCADDARHCDEIADQLCMEALRPNA